MEKAATVRTFLLTLVFVGILCSYILFQARNIISGPVLIIDAPLSGQTVDDSLVIVRGSTRNVAHMTFNDRQIFMDKNGAFTEPILLPVGYTILTIAAEDRFGRTQVKHIELVRTEDEAPFVASEHSYTISNI